MCSQFRYFAVQLKRTRDASFECFGSFHIDAEHLFLIMIYNWNSIQIPIVVSIGSEKQNSIKFTKFFSKTFCCM